MKTITERDGKNVNMQVVGDLHKYPDGSVHTVKEGKAVWEEGGGGGGAVYATFTEDHGTWSCDKTYDELKEAYDSGSIIFGVYIANVVFPMTFVSGGGKTGFSGCTTLAGGNSSTRSISDLYFYAFAVFSDGTVLSQELHEEFQHN